MPGVRSRRGLSAMWPVVIVSAATPRRAAMSAQRSLSVKPVGCSPNSGRAPGWVRLRCSPSRRAGIRVPDSVNTGAVTVRQVITASGDYDARRFR